MGFGEVVVSLGDFNGLWGSVLKVYAGKWCWEEKCREGIAGVL